MSFLSVVLTSAIVSIIVHFAFLILKDEIVEEVVARKFELYMATMLSPQNIDTFYRKLQDIYKESNLRHQKKSST